MILNLTQHNATPEQYSAGVVEPDNKALIQRLLTFDERPMQGEIEERAFQLAQYAYETGNKEAMIGGAPYLMSSLELALVAKGIQPLYAFSKRESIDEPQPDGSVKKTMVFKHEGFIPCALNIQSIQKSEEG